MLRLFETESFTIPEDLPQNPFEANTLLQNSLNDKSPQLNYYGIPNFNKAIAHYESFSELIASFGIEIHFLPRGVTAYAVIEKVKNLFWRDFFRKLIIYIYRK